MELIAQNEAGEIARLGVKVAEDGEKSTGSLAFTFKCKLPLFARAALKALNVLDNKAF